MDKVYLYQWMRVIGIYIATIFLLFGMIVVAVTI